MPSAYDDLFGPPAPASPYEALFGSTETEEERRRREARERIQRNLAIGDEQAARLAIPRKGREGALGRAISSTLWGDLGGGLADMGALPGVLASNPAIAGAPMPFGLPNPLQAVPEDYQSKALDVAESAEAGREMARRHRFEAGVNSPFLNVLLGSAAENVDMVAGGGTAGVKGARALGKAADLTSLIDDAVDQGVRQGAHLGVDEIAGASPLSPEDLPRWLGDRGLHYPPVEYVTPEGQIIPGLPGGPERLGAKKVVWKEGVLRDAEGASLAPAEHEAMLRSRPFLEPSLFSRIEEGWDYRGGPVEVLRYGPQDPLRGGTFYTRVEAGADAVTGYETRGGAVRGVLTPERPLVLDGGAGGAASGIIRQLADSPDDVLRDIHAMAYSPLPESEVGQLLRSYGVPEERIARAFFDPKTGQHRPRPSEDYLRDVIGISMARQHGYDAVVHLMGRTKGRKLYSEEVIDLSDGKNFRPAGAIDPLKQAALDAAEAKADLLGEMGRLKPEDLPVMQQAIQDAEILARLGHPEEAQRALAKLGPMMDRAFPSSDIAGLARASDEIYERAKAADFKPQPEMPLATRQMVSAGSDVSTLPLDASKPIDAPTAVQAVRAQGQAVMERVARPALTPAAERAAFNAEGGGAGSPALTDWLRKNLRSFGEYRTVAEGFLDPRVRRYIGETLPRRVEQMGNEERALLREMQLLSREVDQSTAQMAKASGGQVTASQLRRDMDAARRAGDYTGLPPELQPVAQKAGSFLDRLSQQYVDLGIVDDAMAETFQSNMGRYLHTSHAAFDRPGFLAEVRGTKAWDEARAFIKSEIPDASEDEVVGLLESLADRKQGRPLGFGKQGGVGRKDLTNLIQRDEIPEPLRELMGVYRDYRVNFERSTAKMAHTIAEHRLLRDVADELEQLGVLRQPSPATGKGEAGFYRQVIGGSERSPIAGKYTTPQVAELLEGVVQQSRATWYSYLSGAVKFFKVAASPQTQLRNWESGFLMSMANGNFVGSPRHFIRSAQLQKALITQRAGGTESRLLRFLGAGTPEELEADIARAIQQGVIQRSASGREFASYVEEIGQGPKGLRRLVENKPVGYLSRAYMAGDDFWKFANWKAEADKLGWASGGKVSREVLEREAAEIVSQQLQTYDRAIPLARKLSRNPVIGPFAIFHMEMPRNLINVFRRTSYEFNLAKQAAAAGDTAQAARWTAVASGRLVGVGSALTMFGALKTYVNRKNGITGDKEEAFRRLALPTYAENSQAIVTEVDGDDVTYFDSQFADPYNLMQRIWVAAIARPGDPAERSMRAAEELGRSFLGPELLTGTLVGQAANQDLSTDRPITYESRTPERQILDRFEHARRGLAPGVVVTGERIARAAAGDPKYDLGREVAAVGGPRWRTVNVMESFGYRVADFNESRRRITTDFRAQSTNRDGTPKSAEQIQAAQAEAERSWKRAYGTLEEYVVDLRNWGKSDKEIYDALRDRKVRADVARKLTNGQSLTFADYRKASL